MNFTRGRRERPKDLLGGNGARDYGLVVLVRLAADRQSLVFALLMLNRDYVAALIAALSAYFLHRFAHLFAECESVHHHGMIGFAHDHGIVIHVDDLRFHPDRLGF